jgi:hypothetical protein
VDCPLKPKGTKSVWNGFVNITENGRRVFGSEVASKVFTNIYNVELGKPNVLPDIQGRNPIRGYEGAKGRGYDKKRMSICNGLNRGTCLNLKRC